MFSELLGLGQEEQALEIQGADHGDLHAKRLLKAACKPRIIKPFNDPLRLELQQLERFLES